MARIPWLVDGHILWMCFNMDAEVFKISVNYGLTLNEMINEGFYGVKSDEINGSNFKIEHKWADGNFRIVHLEYGPSSSDIKEYLRAKNLRPATLPELLAFGAKYPDKQGEFPIVALGSGLVGPDGLRVPYLGKCWDKRILYLQLDDPSSGWNNLAVLVTSK